MIIQALWLYSNKHKICIKDKCEPLINKTNSVLPRCSHYFVHSLYLGQTHQVSSDPTTASQRLIFSLETRQQNSIMIVIDLCFRESQKAHINLLDPLRADVLIKSRVRNPVINTFAPWMLWFRSLCPMWRRKRKRREGPNGAWIIIIPPFVDIES